MKTFTDATGKSWNVEINIGAAKRVRDLTGVNLLSPLAGDPPLMTMLTIDPLIQAEVLYALVKPQADAARVTEESFYAIIATRALGDAADAMLEELMGFFRVLGQSTVADAIQANRTLMAAGMKSVEIRAAEAMARMTRSTPSGASPAPPASTPEP